MKVYISSDHAGFQLKEELVPFIGELGFDVEDLGAFEYDENDDYPDLVAPTAKEVSDNPDEAMGVVIGGSGQGEAIVANRFANVRAVVFNGPSANHLTRESGGEQYDEIALSRQHNNANILSLGARFLSGEDAREAVKQWLDTPFSGEERHIRRLEKLSEIDRDSCTYKCQSQQKNTDGKYVKDFDTWNTKKKSTENEKCRLYTVREVWWCRFGVNIGTEQDGKGEWYTRPCIILKGFGEKACLVVPLTTSSREHALRVPVGKVKGIFARANLSQLRVVDTRRLEEKIGFIEKDAFNTLIKTTRNLV